MFKALESRFSSNTDAKQVDEDLNAAPSPPLLELLETEDSEGEPRDIILDAISLLGNAVTQTSKIRRKRILKLCNQDIQDLADEDDMFKEAAPNVTY